MVMAEDIPEAAPVSSVVTPSVHTTHEERQILLKYGKVIGRAIEELITIVSPATFYKWVREAKNAKPRNFVAAVTYGSVAGFRFRVSIAKRPCQLCCHRVAGRSRASTAANFSSSNSRSPSQR